MGCATRSEADGRSPAEGGYSPFLRSCWRRWRQDIAIRIALSLIVYSIAFYAVVIFMGYHRPPACGSACAPAYSTYFEQLNWCLYPLFFLCLIPGLWLSWTPFLTAWRALHQTGVLILPAASDSETVLDELRQWLRAKHWQAVILAAAVAIAVNFLDIKPVYDTFRAATVGEQLGPVCQNQNFFAKWFFDAWSADLPPCQAQEPNPALSEALRNQAAPPAGLRAQVTIVFLAYLQQVAIVFLAALGIARVLLHTWLFIYCEHSAFARRNGLRLQLRVDSPVGEFGLEHWNYHLNNLYWAITPALVGAFLSRAAVPDPALMAPGQKLLGVFVPLIVLLPMIVTILARQSKLPEAWSRVETAGENLGGKFHQQSLWPLDRNWASKLGIIIAFAAAALTLGVEMGSLASFAG